MMGRSVSASGQTQHSSILGHTCFTPKKDILRVDRHCALTEAIVRSSTIADCRSWSTGLPRDVTRDLVLLNRKKIFTGLIPAQE
jgi:hypothetical protein